MKASHVALAVAATVVMGSNFIASRYALEYFPPYLFTALRFLLVALLVIPFVPAPRGNQKKIFAMSFMVAGNFGFVVAGLAAGLDIASCTIVSQLAVPVACLLGAVFLGDRLGKWRISGLFLAFTGMVIAAGSPNVSAHWPGFWLTFLGAVMGGVVNLQMKKLAHVNTYSMLGWQCLFAAFPLMILSLLFEQDRWIFVQNPPLHSLGALAYSVLLTTIFAYAAWFYLLRHNAVSEVAPFSLIAAISSIAFGQFFFSEMLAFSTIVGALLTLGGVGIIVVRRPLLSAPKT